MKFLKTYEEKMEFNFPKLIKKIKDKMKKLNMDKIWFDPPIYHTVYQSHYQGPTTENMDTILYIYLDNYNDLNIFLHNESTWYEHSDKPYDYEVEIWDLSDEEIKEIINYIDNMTPKQIEYNRIKNESEKFNL